MLWCNTCQKWHKVDGDQDIAQYENWGCSLDFTKEEKMEFDVVVTKHKSLVKYLKSRNLVKDGVKILDHASAEDVRDKHVLGVLPHSLSCLTKTFTEIPLRVPAEKRGKELSVKDIEKYSGDITTYSVEKLRR